MQQNKDGERKSSTPFGRFSLVLLTVGVLLHAESFSEFKKHQIATFQKYKDERDNEFQNYLKAQWKAYKKFVSASLYEKPKPDRVPRTKPKPAPKAGPKIFIRIKPLPKIQKPTLPPEVVVSRPKPTLKHPQKIVKKPHKKELAKIKPALPKENIDKTPKQPIKVVKKEQIPPKMFILPKEERQKPVTKPVVVKKDVEFDFFGSKLGFDIPKGLKNAKFYPTNQQGITNYFDAAASSEYEKLLQEIKEIKKSMNLNDWGLYLLVDTIAHKLYKYEDEAQLFDWFVMNKLGYAVKVGLARGHVVAMYYSKKIIYSTPNFRFGKKRYYVVSYYNKGNIGSLYSYRQNYPGATKPLDLSLKSLPIFEPDYKTKKLHFVHLGKNYEITFKYNKNLIDFFATYPQADYKTFFNAPIDPLTYGSIAKSLREYINGQSAAEAMNFVLNFVQNAFEYQTDQQQFGREKVMFAQETLYYKASDCEDRAILYSFLIKDLFGVPILGIKYPNHMATALYVPLDGDKVRIKNKEFVVADPTYINAQIGQAMPQFRGKMPEDFIYVTLR